MPFASAVLPEHRVGYVRLCDEVGLEDIVSGLRALVSDAAWRPEFRVLVDYTTITAPVVNVEDFRALGGFADGLGERLGTSGVWIVAPQRLVATIVDIYRHVRRRGPRPIHRLDRMEDAAAALGLPLDALPAADDRTLCTHVPLRATHHASSRHSLREV